MNRIGFLFTREVMAAAAPAMGAYLPGVNSAAISKIRCKEEFFMLPVTKISRMRQ